MSGNFPGGKSLPGYDQFVQGLRGLDREDEFREQEYRPSEGDAGEGNRAEFRAALNDRVRSRDFTPRAVGSELVSCGS